MDSKMAGQVGKVSVVEPKSKTIFYSFLPKGKVDFLYSRPVISIKINGKFTGVSLARGTHEMDRERWEQVVGSSTYKELAAEGMIEKIADSGEILEQYKNKPIPMANIEKWVKKTFEVDLLQRWVRWIDYQRDPRWEPIARGINSRISSVQSGKAKLMEPSDDWTVFEDDEVPWGGADAGVSGVDWSET
jgi:hypothetical protein